MSNKSPWVLDSSVGKGECPKCKDKKSFSYYVDRNRGNAIIDLSVGKCDHGTNCREHRRPSEWSGWEDYKRKYVYGKVGDEDAVNSENKNIQFINHDEINELEIFNRNYRFVKFMSNLGIKDTEILKIFKMYNVRLLFDKVDKVIFFYEDFDKNITRGKVIEYGVDGYRKGIVDSIHNVLRQGKYIDEDAVNGEYHFFGIHLLNRPENLYKTVCLVESEKSAILASHFYGDDMIWLASGSLTGLTLKNIKVLKDRDVLIYPDNGKLQEITEKAEIEGWRYYLNSLKISDRFEKRYYSKEYDIADFIAFNFPQSQDKINYNKIFMNPEYLKRITNYDIDIKITSDIKRIWGTDGRDYYTMPNYSLTNYEKAKRAKILIDGEEIAEVDCTSIHPRVMGAIFESETGVERPKFLVGDVHMNITKMLGLSTREEGKRIGLKYWNSQITGNTTISSIENREYFGMMDRFIQDHHSELWQWLVSVKNGKSLIEGKEPHTNMKMKLDDVEVRIVNHAIKKLNMPCISVHDAIYVKKSEIKKAEEALEDGIEKYLNKRVAVTSYYPKQTNQ